jgi:hypothetical protein
MGVSWALLSLRAGHGPGLEARRSMNRASPVSDLPDGTRVPRTRGGSRPVHPTRNSAIWPRTVAWRGLLGTGPCCLVESTERASADDQSASEKNSTDVADRSRRGVLLRNRTGRSTRTSHGRGAPRVVLEPPHPFDGQLDRVRRVAAGAGRVVARACSPGAQGPCTPVAEQWAVSAVRRGSGVLLERRTGG